MNASYSSSIRTSGVVFISGLVASLLLFGPFSSTSLAGKAPKAYLIDRALQAIAMQRNDLTVRSALSWDPFALSRFQRWMENPVKGPVDAQEDARNLLRYAEAPVFWIRELARVGGHDAIEPVPLKRHTRYTIRAPAQIAEAVDLLLHAMKAAEKRLGGIRNTVSPEDMALLQRFVHPDANGDGESERAMRELVEAEAFQQALDVAANVDRKGILEAGLTIVKALAEARDLLSQTEPGQKDVDSFSVMTEMGLVEIGGTDSDVHEKNAALIIDLGGDDLYKGQVGAGVNGKCGIVLDLGGNDTYLGKEYTQACGVWGVGVLFDLAGDDLYKAGRYCQGAGLFGFGLLFDRRGSDTYIGEEFVQAASSWGWGGLIDLDGEDTYQCHHSGQAYAGVLGVSALSDLAGNDKYLSGVNTPDSRETDMNQSFSQGFALGKRNLAAGGFALLADQSGNDVYQCQYFGQGSSYWMGVGVLYDESGNDVYMARRYAQGAGFIFHLGCSWM